MTHKMMLSFTNNLAKFSKIVFALCFALHCNTILQANTFELELAFSNQSPPSISIDTEIDTLIAFDTVGLAKILKVEAFDNDGSKLPVTTTLSWHDRPLCFANNITTATATFKAMDNSGSIDSISKDYTIIRPNEIDNLAKTKDVFIFNLEIPSGILEAPGLEIGVHKNGKFTARDTVMLSTMDYIGGYILISKILTSPTAFCGVRTTNFWELVDWCRPNQGPIPIDTTFIETVPNFAEISLDTHYLDLGPFTCTFDITQVTKPTTNFNCNDNSPFKLNSVSRIENGQSSSITNSSELTRLTIGSFELEWVIEADFPMGLLQDTLKQVTIIQDVNFPSAVCPDSINIDLLDELGVRINATNMGFESFDACGVAKREIRIIGTNTDWSEFVDISCEQANQDLQLEMRATDVNGKENICWLDLIVTDKSPFNCENLPPVIGDITNFELEVSLFKDISGYSKLDSASWINLTPDIKKTTSDLILNQNFPNPFDSKTTIEFHLPNKGLATLQLIGIQGNILKTINRNFDKGYHQVVIDIRELGKTGTIYYQLTANGKTRIKKMIILE